MKNIAKWLMVAAVAAGFAWTAASDVGIRWTAGERGVAAYGGDPDDGPGVAEASDVTWQLIYAGANEMADAVNPADPDCLGGDDELIASRLIPAGGGASEDGTS